MVNLASLLLKSVLIGIIVASIDLSFAETELRKSGWTLLMMGLIFFTLAFVVEFGIEASISALERSNKPSEG